MEIGFSVGETTGTKDSIAGMGMTCSCGNGVET